VARARTPNIETVPRPSLMLAAPLLFSLVCTAQNQKSSTGPDRKAQARIPIDGANIFQPQFATCHGADGRRHGPASATLKRKPPNLTRKRIRLASPERSGNAHLRSNLSRRRIRSREGRSKAQSHHPASGIYPAEVKQRRPPGPTRGRCVHRSGRQSRACGFSRDAQCWARTRSTSSSPHRCPRSSRNRSPRH